MTGPSPLERREQEEQFIRSRVETISKIKEEIEMKSETVSKEFANELQKTLDYPQKAETYKLDGNNFNAFDSLEKAKSLARRTLLQSQALSILKMEDWHTRNKEQTDRITSLWRLYIEPSFDLPAFLGVAHFENHMDGVFCIGSSEDTVSITGIHTTFPKTWTDIVAQQSIDLSDIKNHGLSLDGIVYKFQMGSLSAQRMQLEFDNPHTTSLVEFERTFIKTAESIVSAETSQEGMSYIENIWKKYAHK